MIVSPLTSVCLSKGVDESCNNDHVDRFNGRVHILSIEYYFYLFMRFCYETKEISFFTFHHHFMAFVCLAYNKNSDSNSDCRDSIDGFFRHFLMVILMKAHLCMRKRELHQKSNTENSKQRKLTGTHCDWCCCRCCCSGFFLSFK